MDRRSIREKQGYLNDMPTVDSLYACFSVRSYRERGKENTKSQTFKICIKNVGSQSHNTAPLVQDNNCCITTTLKFNGVKCTFYEFHVFVGQELEEDTAGMSHLCSMMSEPQLSWLEWVKRAGIVQMVWGSCFRLCPGSMILLHFVSPGTRISKMASVVS